jgi:hypothetical protein
MSAYLIPKKIFFRFDGQVSWETVDALVFLRMWPLMVEWCFIALGAVLCFKGDRLFYLIKVDFLPISQFDPRPPCAFPPLPHSGTLLVS